MNTILQQMTERLRRIAIADHAKYPQYKGYFDKWVLAKAIGKVVKYKGGSCLPNGRWVLASPDLRNWYDPDNGNVCRANNLVSLGTSITW